jgi:hypothetical protein
MTSRGKNKRSANLGKLIHAALSEQGLNLPETDAEIARAEDDLAINSPKLPVGLQNPHGFLTPRSALGLVPMRRTAPVSDIEPELARAAREGGKISAEVEAKMRADRIRAEADAKAGKK